MVFETLNKLKWTGKLGHAEIIFVSRGSPGDRRKISGKEITQLKRGYFYFKDKDSETYIPNHRVLEIRLKGETIWKRRSGKGT